MKSGNLGQMTPTQEIDLLKLEYERMTTEIRMYSDQYSSKYFIFASIVLTAIVYALGEKDLYIIYPIVPIFIFMICEATITQTYLIACIAERVRQIELRLAKINGGRAIVTWEHVMAKRLIVPCKIRMKKKDGGAYRSVNPIHSTFITSAVAILAVTIFCLIKAYDVITGYWLIMYYMLTLVAMIRVIRSGVASMRMSNNADKLIFYSCETTKENER